MSKIGFVGAGVMGAPMIGHLLDAGHEVAVHVRRREAAAAPRSPNSTASTSAVLVTLVQTNSAPLAASAGLAA